MVRSDVVEIVRRLKRISGLETLAMTTNGVTLARKLPALKEAGLDAINLRFNFATKRDQFCWSFQHLTLLLYFQFGHFES